MLEKEQSMCICWWSILEPAVLSRVHSPVSISLDHGRCFSRELCSCFMFASSCIHLWRECVNFQIMAYSQRASTTLRPLRHAIAIILRKVGLLGSIIKVVLSIFKFFKFLISFLRRFCNIMV